LAQVAISLNKRTYRFECGEEQVERLEKLANYLKSKLDALMVEHGTVGDDRLVIMAALTLADELFDARADVDSLLDGTTDEQTEKLRSVAGKPEPFMPGAGAGDASRKAGS
jgi:cell division protein ZapA